MWRQDISRAAAPRAKLSRAGLRWALAGIVVQHPIVARVADGPGVAWGNANDAVLTEGKRVLIDDPLRSDGVTAIGEELAEIAPDRRRSDEPTARRELAIHGFSAPSKADRQLATS